MAPVHVEVLDLFALGIVNLRELRSVANALQECRLTSIRSADDENSESTNAIEMLFDRFRIQMNCLFEVFCNYISGISHSQDRNLVVTHSFS